MRELALAASLILTACGQGSGNRTDNASSEPGNASTEVPAGAERLWVTSQRLDRRTCPSERCGVVGQLSFREAANVLERRGEWARITNPYPAACEGGGSAYVDRGNASCTPANGITDGRFAEWVSAADLSPNRPPDPADTASGAERLVAQSDDFARHRAVFVRAANELIQSGRCTPADFEEQGGWVKSTNHRDEPIYFTYCGGMTVANRIYLDAATGRIFSLSDAGCAAQPGAADRMFASTHWTSAALRPAAS